MYQCTANLPTVDGRNPANQLRLVVFPIIYKVLDIPGGAGFCPSTVSLGGFNTTEEILVKLDHFPTVTG